MLHKSAPLFVSCREASSVHRQLRLNKVIVVVGEQLVQAMDNVSNLSQAQLLLAAVVDKARLYIRTSLLFILLLIFFKYNND